MTARISKLITEPREPSPRPKSDDRGELFELVALQVRGLLEPSKANRLTLLAAPLGSGALQHLREQAREFWRRVDLAAQLPEAERDLTHQTNRHSHLLLLAADRITSAKCRVQQCTDAAASVKQLKKQFPNLLRKELK